MVNINLTKQDKTILGLQINTAMQYFRQQRQLVKSIMKFKSETENSNIKSLMNGVNHNIKTDKKGYPTKVEPDFLADYDDPDSLQYTFIKFNDWFNNSPFSEMEYKFNKKFNISVINTVYAIINNYLMENYHINIDENISRFISINTIINNVDTIDIERKDILDGIEQCLSKQ